MDARLIFRQPLPRKERLFDEWARPRSLTGVEFLTLGIGCFFGGLI
jgi:hypothetical protein